MSKAEQLAAVLDEFLAVSLDVEAAAVVSSDGLPMASALPPTVQEDRLAAMSAALLSLGERAAEGLDKGELAQVYVEGSDGNVVLMAAGRHAVLVAMTAKHAKAGLVLFEMRSSARRVEQVLEEPYGLDPSPARGRHEAVASHRVDPTPDPPAQPSPYTAPEPGAPRPAWEEQPVQTTPEWEAQPAAQQPEQPEWAESSEGAEQWGERQSQEPQNQEPQTQEGSDQWAQQQHEQAQQDEPPKQWDEDENSSLKSW
ncbi:MAG: roadblock/LC7 domain-containing protein [Actinomycetota bacterium]